MDEIGRRRMKGDLCENSDCRTGIAWHCAATSFIDAFLSLIEGRYVADLCQWYLASLMMWWWWTVCDWFSWLQDADVRIPRQQTDVKSSLALYSRNKALLKQWQSLIKVVCDHHDHRDNYDGQGDQDDRDHHDQCWSSSMIQTVTKLHGSFSCLILTCN